MTEQIGQSLVDAKGKTPAMGIDETFRFIGELARRAAQGDEAAKLSLEILKNQQLAEIQNLGLELQVLNIRNIARTALQFMRLPEPE